MGFKSIVLCCLIFGYGSLFGAIINVGPPPASIQTAINSAVSGDTIQLSSGTYVEQIQIISKSLTLIGAGQDITIIQSPDATSPLTQFFTFQGNNFWCVVMIDNQAAPASQNVLISDLTVSGSDQQDTTILPAPSPGFYGSGNRFFAIGYHEANGTIDHVHTTSTRQSINFDELAGGGMVNASEVATVVFNVSNSLIDFYQRSGIDCRGSTLTANIQNSTINRGYVLTPNTTTAGPNGIQYSGSTTGTIQNNTVESNISTVPGAQASGIIVINAGPNIQVVGNTADNNDIAIAGINCGDNLEIDSNTYNFTTTPGVNTVEGLVLQDTNGTTIISSNIFNNLPNIALDISSTTGSLQTYNLSFNQFIGAQTGILVSGVTGTPSTGPIVTMNHDSFIGTTGYYIQENQAPLTAPNDIWPTTDTVSFDGMISGHMTLAQFNQLLTKIFDKHNDATLGLVLDYIMPVSPTVTMVAATSGPVTGGNTVTITGLGFVSENTTVLFGSIPATNVVMTSATTITVTVPAGVIGTVNITVTTPFGTSPVTPVDQYTYVTVTPTTPLPPVDFIGFVTKNTFLNKKEYTLNATWNPSPTAGVVLYRIYNNKHVVASIPAGSPLIFFTCLSSKHAAKKYQISAVNAANIESVHVPIILK